jgi:hypothetical protein
MCSLGKGMKIAPWLFSILSVYVCYAFSLDSVLPSRLLHRHSLPRLSRCPLQHGRRPFRLAMKSSAEEDEEEWDDENSLEDEEIDDKAFKFKNSSVQAEWDYYIRHGRMPTRR